MEQLTRTIVRDLEANKPWLLTMLSLIKKTTTSVELQEEPGEILITLLMEQREIEHAVIEAVKEVLGTEYLVADISVGCGGRLIYFAIFSNC